jgi:hypothetical protein
VPQERIGIVLLANTSYPLEARAAAGYHILKKLAEIGTPATR